MTIVVSQCSPKTTIAVGPVSPPPKCMGPTTTIFPFDLCLNVQPETHHHNVIRAALVSPSLIQKHPARCRWKELSPSHKCCYCVCASIRKSGKAVPVSRKDQQEETGWCRQSSSVKHKAGPPAPAQEKRSHQWLEWSQHRFQGVLRKKLWCVHACCSSPTDFPLPTIVGSDRYHMLESVNVEFTDRLLSLKDQNKMPFEDKSILSSVIVVVVVFN